MCLLPWRWAAALSGIVSLWLEILASLGICCALLLEGCPTLLEYSVGLRLGASCLLSAVARSWNMGGGLC